MNVRRANRSERASEPFCIGAVRQPGRYPVADDLTLDLLLRVAGGTLPLADLKNVILRTYVVKEDGAIDLQRSKVIDLTSLDPASIRLSGEYDIQDPGIDE